MTAEPRIVLGFDARVGLSSLRELWPPEERESSLLRTDVRVPLSVDYLIWPSAWPPDAPGWRGPVQGMWDNRNRLISALAGVPATDPWWPIAVAIMSQGLSSIELSSWKSRTEPISPKRVSARWRSLGFDVADGFLTSALVRFHSAESLPGLRRDWGSRLNDVHLFADSRSAREFASHCETTNARGHSPYFAYELLLMEHMPNYPTLSSK